MNEHEQIDPVLALEILPQKIAERKRMVTSLALDLSILGESQFCDPAEKAILEKNLAAQRNFLELYERRLDSVHRAIGV